MLSIILVCIFWNKAYEEKMFINNIPFKPLTFMMDLKGKMYLKELKNNKLNIYTKVVIV